MQVQKVALGALAILLWSATMAAAEWPERTITVVSPYPPGGTNDVIGRAFTDRLAAKLGQPVVVDNRPGAAGIVGSAFVSRAKADGYTLLTANNGALILQPLINSQAKYTILGDFTPIARYAVSYPFLGVRGDLPAQTFAEFITLMKKSGADLKYGSSGVGSFGQFVTGYLASLVGAQMPTHIPYRGSAQALTDLLGGRIDFMIDPVVLQQKGALRVLVSTSPERLPAVPDVPGASEAGLPQFNLFGWFGLLGPAGLPTEIVDKLSRAVAEIATEPEVKLIVERTGSTMAPLSGVPFAATLREETVRFKEIKEKAAIPNIE